MLMTEAVRGKNSGSNLIYSSVILILKWFYNPPFSCHEWLIFSCHLLSYFVICVSLCYPPFITESISIRAYKCMVPCREDHGVSRLGPDMFRNVIKTEKVKLLLTLYRPLTPPLFLLSKAKDSCTSPPPMAQD